MIIKKKKKVPNYPIYIKNKKKEKKNKKFNQ